MLRYILTTSWLSIGRPSTVLQSTTALRVLSALSPPGHCSSFRCLFTMPSSPHSSCSAINGGSAAAKLDLSALTQAINVQEQQRQQAYDLSRQMQVALAQAKFAIDHNTDDSAHQRRLDECLQHPLIQQDGTTAIRTDVHSNRTPRLGSLSQRVEDYVRLDVYRGFLATGTLNAPLTWVTDEEYLGACMGLCQDVAHYGLGRATVRDVASVQAGTDLVAQLHDYFLRFDFRNGPLRRKFDGTKYTLKALETLLYELAITDNSSGADQQRQPHKRAKAMSLLPTFALEAIKARMEHRDALREHLIKRCRDGQKAAKQSIFALHRPGDVSRARHLLADCRQCIHDLTPLVREEPPLRAGSYANMLEEYVEAHLFWTWLHGRRDNDNDDHNADDRDDDGNPTAPTGILLSIDEFGDIALEPEEYLGGLCDLTGEIGRLAVQRGTARHGAGVEQCLHTNLAILMALSALERLPPGIGKKMDTVRRSVEKLERMLYEMSLSEAAGGRNIASEEAPSMAPAAEDDDIGQ